MLKSEIRKNREQKIILALNKFGIMTVEMFIQLNIDGLGKTSKRNVLRVLNKMVKDGYLQEMRKDFKVYCVYSRGFGHWEHRIMMNKFIIDNGLQTKARLEPNVKIGSDQFRPDFMVPIIPDAKTEKDWRFYEVDRTQKRKTNIEKIERYKRLGLQFEIICASHRKHLWEGCVVNVV